MIAILAGVILGCLIYDLSKSLFVGVYNYYKLRRLSRELDKLTTDMLSILKDLQKGEEDSSITKEKLH